MIERDKIYTIAICDPQEQFRKSLIEIIAQNIVYGQNILLIEYNNGRDLLKDVNHYHNLIFIDTQIKGDDGLQVIEEIRKRNRDTILVICTDEQYPSPELFKAQPFRYLRKYPDLIEIRNEMEVIMQETKKRSKDIFLLTESIGKVYAEDIYYIAKIKRACEIILTNGQTCIIRSALDNLYILLRLAGFEYAHSSYIVNLRYVEKIDLTTITLIDNTVLSLSRTKKQDFKKRFLYYQEHLLNDIKKHQ